MYVVTGGAGFIGSNLLATLEARGLGPLAAIDRTDDAHKIRNTAKRDTKYFIAPEQTFDFLDFQARNIKGIFHLGALTSTTERDLVKLDEVNVRLSRALWAWCTRHRGRSSTRHRRRRTATAAMVSTMTALSMPSRA